ncbi:LuxR family maltose regulon positive regulatory protein [Paraburkholderia bannensis]|uniref:LuxR family maltose regulon positive regulatory protein n=1 Tax=Paraburkholderia bannensis TaxID=765414 RepID=A0A7W9TRJ4_9BURK|nr:MULTISPECIES: LuxR C-terminal-related transcriptional regulator [Paraburkholderia]MBB3255773.1 LuxR family maltose regulon positive regulatory protein [Paraburkholderia sp. WP4_3_2]MBB6100216.1 LuxR family maltose regulon positive regulatory protein [Paraburkholderia bannensis]
MNIADAPATSTREHPRQHATNGIVASRLMPPAGSSTQLVRSALLDTLARAHASQAVRIVLIRAAAGYGKTTLMQQYAAHCGAHGIDASWLRLHSANNDLERLLLDLDAVLPGQRSASSADAIIDHIAAHDRPLAILFDDFDTIHSASVLAFVQTLIDALPPGAMLIVATRATPGLGVGRLRARGALLDIQSAALRFTLAEAGEYVREKCGLALDDTKLAALHHGTEGWATALYLATLSLRTHPDPGAFVDAFSGAHAELADYFAEEVFARQNEACRAFLLDTCVLPHFPAALCDALTGRGDARERLDELERSCLFLEPLDDERTVYRYHRLFASYLRHCLRAAQPQREANMHALAAQWYLALKRPVPAIDHLLDAGEPQRALAEISRHARTLMGAGRIRLMMGWLERIDANLIAAQPEVGLTYAWVLLLNRRYGDAMRATQTLVGDANAALESQVLRAVLHALTGQMDACIASGASLLAELPDRATFAGYTLCNALAFSYVSVQRYDEARGVLSRALGRSREHPFAVTRTMAETIEGIIDLLQGRLGTALARLDTALAGARAEQRGAGAAGSEGIAGGYTSVDAARALALYERNELDALRRLLANTLPRARSAGTTDALIATHVLSARSAWLAGDVDQWLRLLAELEQSGRVIESGRSVSAAWLERARVATLEGRLEAAGQALEIAELDGAWAHTGYAWHATEIDCPVVVRARLDIARRRDGEAEAALRVALDAALGQQRYWRALKLRILLSLALAGRGAADAALDELTQALRIASHERFVRAFLDEGPALLALLARWSARGAQATRAAGVAPGFVAQLLEAAEVGASCEPVAAAHTLSARELEVLRMLSAGHRNRVIAEKLFVSELTVKAHLRKINAKLGAQNRTQAVAIGRELGVIG